MKSASWRTKMLAFPVISHELRQYADVRRLLREEVLQRTLATPRYRHRMRLAISVLTLALGGLWLACTDFAVRSQDSGNPDGSVDGSVNAPDGQSPTRPLCPDDMVKIIDAYCIDKTEVSANQYLTFLDAVAAGEVTSSDSRCGWNTDFSPNALGKGATKPVIGIDFCDAVTYCQFRKKRLCGARKYLDARTSEWVTACSANGTRKYPYGNEFDAGLCVVERDAGEIRATDPSLCEGGYPGLYEMVGNVHEWTDETETTSDAGPQSDFVRFRGGSYGQTPALNYDCKQFFTLPRASRTIDIGFRCCADLQ